MGRKVVYIIIGLLAAVLILSMTKDKIVKVSVEKGIELVTGQKLSIKSLRVGLIRTFVDVKGIRFHNPGGYEDKLMMDMPAAYVDYDLSEALKNRIHIYDMRIHLKEFVVVKNAEGQLNLDALEFVREARRGKKTKEKGKLPEIQIDKLELKIGKAVYKDYSQGEEPRVRVYEINIDERYTNIKNPEALASLIVVRSMAKTNIAKTAGFNIKELEEPIFNTLATAENLTVQTVRKTGEVLGTTKEAASGTIEKTTEKLKKATGSLGEVFMSPFKGREEKK
jgi:hypothetical protein